MTGLDAQDILKTIHQPFVVLDGALVVLSANKAFYDTFDVEPDKTEGRAIYDLGNRQWDIPNLRALLEDILPNHGTVENYLVEHRFETIGRRIMRINARQVPERDPGILLLAIDDITWQEDQRRETERQQELAEIIIDAAPVSFLVLGKDLKVIRANDTFYDTFAVSRAETEGQLVYRLGNDQWDIPKLRELLEDVLPDNDTFNGFEVEHEFEDIGLRTMMLNARRINTHQLILLAIDDLTEKRAFEREQLAEAARRDFILGLVDRQRGEAEPAALVDMTCAALGTHLNAARVFHVGMDDGDGHGSLPHVWRNGRTTGQVADLRIADFAGPLLDHLQAGCTLVIEDMYADANTEIVGLLASLRGG